MDAERWTRMQELFHAALDLPAGERRAFLEPACQEDEQLLEDVLALLEEDENHTAFLERDLAQVAREVLDGSVPSVRQIGPYRIREVLGRGGMGVVYLAERDDLQSRAAIKVLRDATLSPARLERFAREQQMLAQLTHSSIARLHDADVLSDGTPYFVMEYVAGMPLTQYCQTHGCGLEERLRLFAQVCEAVQYAHGQAVIHRDLKPSNIFVTAGPGGEPTIKLLDFGIAKQFDELEAAVTQTGLRLMTPAYAAPEQLRGEPVGVYSDVYALGVILYELLTDELPYDASDLTPGQLESAILRRDIEKPSARTGASDGEDAAPLADAGARARADLDVLCLTAMHKDPQRRYGTVEALLRDLEHYRTGRPLEAQPDSAAYRATKFLQRNRQPVLAAFIVWAVVTGLVVYYTLRVAEQRDRAQAEAAKAAQVSEYLIGLFEAGDPFQADADGLEVRTLLQRGVTRAEALANQPEVQAHILDVLGRVHTMRSEYDEAARLLHRALDLRREMGAPLDIAETLANLGRLYSDSGAYDSAEVAMREALALRERDLPPRHPDLAVTLDRLGVVLNRKGKYREAEALYRLALNILRDIDEGPSEELGATLNNLAVNRFDQGDYEGAERYFRQCMALERQVYGPEHPSLAVGYSNLGVLLDTQGKYEAADSMLTAALRIKRAKLGTDHYETAFSLTQLGGMLRRKGDYDRAERYLREAMEIEARVLGENHRNRGVTLNHLGLTLQGRGDYPGSESHLRRAVAIFEDDLGPEHPYTTIVQGHLAYVLHLQGRDDEAERLFQKALPLLEVALPPDHDQLALVRGKYGAMLADQARYAEAEPILVDSHRQLEAQLGPEHPETRIAARRLVDLYDAWDRPGAADRFRTAAAEEASLADGVAAGPG